MQVARPQLGWRAVPSASMLIGMVVALALLGGAGYFVYQRFNPTVAPLAQQTAPVTRGSIAASVNATGTVAATSASRLGFRASGRIADVNVVVGDQVKAGQVLARLDTTDL